MGIFRVSLCVVVLVAVVAANPAKNSAAKENFDSLQVEDNPSEPQIQPRVTCDLLGPTGWGDALCAAHCISKGYSGGYCNAQKVCVCR
uniref:Putative defensin n=1 Tax=Lutzomyia longipalpis TaxID=7200 RepID=A0A7G3AFH8_LUTLO